MNNKRILALDFGESRIGVAVSDMLLITAQGVGVIKRTSLKDDINKIKEYVKEYDCFKIVLGNPINLDGKDGTRAVITKEFYEKLKNHFDIDIVLWDERLSTKEAERALEMDNVKWRKKRDVIDMMAAQIILSSYLDYNKFNNGGI